MNLSKTVSFTPPEFTSQSQLLCVAAQHKSSRINFIWMHTGRLLGEVDPGHARKIILLKWSGWG